MTKQSNTQPGIIGEVANLLPICLVCSRLIMEIYRCTSEAWWRLAQDSLRIGSDEISHSSQIRRMGQHLRRDPWCLAKVYIRSSGPLNQDINTEFIGNVELTWLAPVCLGENNNLMCAYMRGNMLTNCSVSRQEGPKLRLADISASHSLQTTD